MRGSGRKSEGRHRRRRKASKRAVSTSESGMPISKKVLSKALVLDAGAQRCVRKVHVKGEYGAGVESPLQIKHIAFARLMARFIKCDSRFRLPGRSYELFR
jgi:hypothetical protein